MTLKITEGKTWAPGPLSKNWPPSKSGSGFFAAYVVGEGPLDSVQRDLRDVIETRWGDEGWKEIAHNLARELEDRHMRTSEALASLTARRSWRSRKAKR